MKLFSKPVCPATTTQAIPLRAKVVTALVACALPGVLLAQFGGADEKVCGFFDSITGLLNMASIAVVTIAIIFAGYQIAFAHKRIADVAPILIGGLLIGAAGQVARMLLGPEAAECTAMLVQVMPGVYA